MAQQTAALGQDELDALAALSTPTIANALEIHGDEFRLRGYLDPSVRAVLSGRRSMVGYACTARMSATSPPSAEQQALRPRMWERIAASPAPRVVVIEDLDDPPVGAYWGEVQANIHRALGCVGVVTNGGVRDLDEVRELGGFSFFAGSVMVSHAWAHLVEIDTPVTVGGARVSPGDLLIGDRHGVVTVPHHLARTLPDTARQIEDSERLVIDLCQSPDFSIERLGEVMRRRGR